MYNNQEIADRLKKIVKSQGKSMKAVLEDCSINKNFIYDFVHKNTETSVKTFSVLADYLKVSTNFLLTGIEEDAPSVFDKIRDILPEDYTIQSETDNEDGRHIQILDGDGWCYDKHEYEFEKDAQMFFYSLDDYARDMSKALVVSYFKNQEIPALTKEEIELINVYRSLDNRGKSKVTVTAYEEHDRVKLQGDTPETQSNVG